MTRLQLALAWAAIRRRGRNHSRNSRGESGQAMVESAIVIPLMLFFILGIIQLAMMHHAKVMTEYAAFNAARAGIVWNADPFIMENAALISLMPTYEGLKDQMCLDNLPCMLKRILQRALMYQVNRRISQAVGLMRQGAGNLIGKIPGGWLGDKAKDFLNSGKDKIVGVAENVATTALSQGINAALGADDDRMVKVEILNPAGGILKPAVMNLGIGPLSQQLGLGGVQQMVGGTFGLGQLEIDFDDFSNRGATRLTIRVQYLYMMRIPFANWIIHQAWLAGQAGKQLYGAVWNPQQNVRGETGFRDVNEVRTDGGSGLLGTLDKLAREGVYLVPMTATYSMRMQSNPYRSNIQMAQPSGNTGGLGGLF